MASYFSAPSDHLDPALFSWDNTLKESVSHPLITAACETLKRAGLVHPEDWLNMWLTGSGITYQWQENNDLDVQLGIDYDLFVRENPRFGDVGQYDMENKLNTYLRTFLWPKMEHATFDGKEFTVTFFWNREVENDITAIHPYAAYNIVDNRWVVEPPQIPPDPHTLYPQEWFNTAGNDEIAARRIEEEYLHSSSALFTYQPGSPGAVNTQTRMNLLRAQAQTLYDDIHQGRRQAFASGGKGYYDYYNFRWQQAKEAGTKDRLKYIIDMARQARDEKETALYGKPISSAQEALEDAFNLRLGHRYDG